MGNRDTMTNILPLAVCGMLVVIGLLCLMWPSVIEQVAVTRLSEYERWPILKRLLLTSWVEGPWYLLGLRIMGVVFSIAGGLGIYVILRGH
jgi:hypothetical protein